MHFELSTNPETTVYLKKNKQHPTPPEHRISKLEWFLKDHVTLETGVTDDENLALHRRNKL